MALTSEQALLQETTARFLQDRWPPTALRKLRGDAAGFDRAGWQQGADLGWTSLLVSSGDGGGGVSDDSLIDLSLVAFEFGRHAAPGPLLPANVVAASLSRWGSGSQRAKVLPGVMNGSIIPVWCWAEPPPNGRLGAIATTATVSGDHFVLNGRKRPIEAAAQADLLLVTARAGDRLGQFLVPADAEGVEVVPLEGIDVTRRLAEVRLHDVVVSPADVISTPDDGMAAVETQLRWASVIQSSESVGAMDAVLAMTVQWAFDRHSFGRPLASYQEIKHRFADMKMWLEASQAVAQEAAHAVQEERRDAAELVSAAKAYIGLYGAELVQDCIQIHGGIGVTFDHDLHLYARRVIGNRVLLGSPNDHLERLADLAEAGSPT
jgi:alkylation response protein AidB-like acyl-CoA dehydrogenase